MQKTDTLIRTKLHLPFTRPGLVSRPRLQEQITQGLSRSAYPDHRPRWFWQDHPGGILCRRLWNACRPGCLWIRMTIRRGAS